ncbi:MAG: hypothetical protein COA99_12580, partial [Moraxellaceae bacterium]
FAVRARVGVISLSLLLIPLWVLTSSFVHLVAADGGFSIAPVFKVVFVALAFIIGSQGARVYGWQLGSFGTIGLVLLLSGIASLFLGRLIGITGTDSTYEEGLVGVSVHPASTAMLISTSIPYLIGLENKGRYLAVISYLCFLLTMRKAAIFGVFPFIRVARRSDIFKSTTFLVLIIAFVSVPIVVTTFDMFEVYMERLMSSFSGDDYSGLRRLVFWSLVIDKVSYFDVFELLFGEGAGALSDPLFLRFGMVVGAHNDFLDLLFSHGVIPALALFVFYISVAISLFKHNIHNQPVEYWCSWGILFYLFFNSFVSGGSLDVQAAGLYFALGVCLEKCNNIGVNE